MTAPVVSAATAAPADRAERRAVVALDDLQKRVKTVVTKSTGALDALVPRIVGLEAEQANEIRKLVADLRALLPKG